MYHAKKPRKKMLEIMEQHIADAGKASVVCPAAAIFLGMNTICVDGENKADKAFDELQKEMEKKCSPEF